MHGGKYAPKRILVLHLGTYMLPEVAKAGHYPIKTRRHCLGNFTAEPRSLNNYTACHMQASQVSAHGQGITLDQAY